VGTAHHVNLPVVSSAHPTADDHDKRAIIAVPPGESREPVGDQIVSQ
jgi:hypothetical protein